jgi:Omp85 superfamily domain
VGAWLACVVLVLFVPRSRAAEPPPGTLDVSELAAENGPDHFVLPVVTYSPETSLGLGAAYLLLVHGSGAAATRSPNLVATLAMVTLHRQLIAAVQPEWHLLDDRLRLWSKLEYQYFPDRFFGIGNHTAASGVLYTRRLARLRMWPQWGVTRTLYAGLAFDYQHVLIIAPEEEPLFLNLRGVDGGSTIGAGATLTWDRRDSSLAARSGTLLEAALLPHLPGLNRHPFVRATFDARGFLDLGGAHVLAVRAYGEATQGTPPFHQLPQLGGPDLLRGYYRGRFRDTALVAAELEYRSPFIGKFGAAAFVGAGQVFPELTAFTLRGFHAAAGIGARLALDSHGLLHMRCDGAIGSDSAGLYVAMLEIF